MRKSIVAGVAVTSAAAFALIAPGQAGAVTTTTTFTIAAGSLAITAPSNALLQTNSAAAEPVATGTFSDVTVTDTRRGTTDWTVYVSGGGFTRTGGTDSLPSKYTTGDARVMGTADVDDSYEFTRTGWPEEAPSVAVTVTGVSGLNTVSWNPTVSVDVPDDALAGQYTSTVTHSVS